MLTGNDNGRFARAFTLIELIFVMILLTALLAVSAPSLSRSFRQRNLEQEAAQLLALTEYARDEAVSQGVPMRVWMDAASGRFGMQAREGYTGDAAREKAFALPDGLRFDPAPLPANGGDLPAMAEFEPDGTLTPESLSLVRIFDASGNAVALVQGEDGWGYEIVKETP